MKVSSFIAAGPYRAIENLPQRLAHILSSLQILSANISKCWKRSHVLLQSVDQTVHTTITRMNSPYNTLANHVWKATPYIIGCILFPWAFYIVGCIFAFGYQLTKKHPNFSPVVTGMGISFIASGAGSIAIGALSHNPVTTISGIFQTVLGGAALLLCQNAEKMLIRHQTNQLKKAGRI